MATIVTPQSFTYRDAKGYTWRLQTHISYVDTSAATIDNGYIVGGTIRGALSGLGPGTLPVTNSVFQAATGIYGAKVAFAYGTAAQYLNAEDKLELALLDSGGSVHKFGIGSPVIAAFLADQETGKGSQLADVVAAFTTPSGAAFACTPNGLPFVAAVGSLLIRRRQRRKVSIYTKSSNLDEPGE